MEKKEFCVCAPSVIEFNESWKYNQNYALMLCTSSTNCKIVDRQNLG